MKQHYILKGAEYNRISKPSNQSWHTEKSNGAGAHVPKYAAQNQLCLNFSAWPCKRRARPHFLWRSLQVTWAKRPIWNKQPYFSAPSLAALLPQLAGQSRLARPKSRNSRCLAHPPGAGSPCPALLVLLSLGQKAVALPDMHAAFFLLVKHSWAAGFSYRGSMRDTVNSRSITTLRYNNPTWLEMLYFIWRWINNRLFACN